MVRDFSLRGLQTTAAKSVQPIHTKQEASQSTEDIPF
jgi:hypothetical protein